MNTKVKQSQPESKSSSQINIELDTLSDESISTDEVENKTQQSTDNSLSNSGDFSQSLLGRAQQEQDDDLEEDLNASDIPHEEYLNDERGPSDFDTDITEPFSPPLVESDDDILDFQENSIDGRGGSGGHSQGDTTMAEQPLPEQQQGGGGSAYHDVFGVGTLGASLFGSLPNFKKTPEQIREKATQSYQKQQNKLDQLIFNAKNRGADISGSHVGKIQQGYIEQDIVPPEDAMKSAFSMDRDCQKSWVGLQKDLEKIEQMSVGLQKTSIQAGFDHESSAAEIEEKIADFHQELSTDLQGITDDKGNKFTDRIAESTKRVQDILKKILESLASLVGINKEQSASQVAQ